MNSVSVPNPEQPVPDRRPLKEDESAASFDPAEMIREHQTGVWRYLRALGCDASLADDLTQETFLAVLRRPFEEHSAVATATYLRRTAKNQYITHLRRLGRVVATAEIEVIDQSWTRWAGRDEGEALLDALRDCLTQVSDRARQALALRFRDRASRSEIAEALALSEHGAKNLLQRAKHKLRHCIESKLE